MAWTHCTTCGTEINDNETTCGSCGSPQPARSNNATLLQRFVGALIDGITQGVILIPIAVILLGGIQAVMQSLTQRSGGFLIRFALESLILSQLVFLILNGYLLLRKGQTIGKLAMGIKIVDLEGNLPDFGKSFVLRYFLMAVIRGVPFLGGLFGLIDILIIFGKDRRCLHDYIAGTRVIPA